ncbi:hypothetical protein HMPREF9141_1253 [Prevotella multiformis DSM 16608]|uniref:Uncharacterized protein n=1 Tax=Prevotella multiformis DSM 16608 TaxID=888743 RepID=F0F6N1_9BACT|nr:hypothetical protein HMPREF9141_1253 [Prevotella multiformis DSM 16608]
MHAKKAGEAAGNGMGRQALWGRQGQFRLVSYGIKYFNITSYLSKIPYLFRSGTGIHIQLEARKWSEVRD